MRVFKQCHYKIIHRLSMNLDKENCEDKNGANVKFPPPLIPIVVVLIAYFIHRAFPLTIWSGYILHIVGFILIIAGIGLGLVFFVSFKKAGIRIEPWRPTNHMVTSGVYAYTRNPAYLSFCIIIIGLGFIYNSLWILFSFIPASYLVWVLVIKKEEAYLEAKFGEKYTHYKEQVRRWI